MGKFSKEKAKRFVNSDGSFNVVHVNRKKTVNEAYTYFIRISWYYFLLLLTLIFIAMNSFFALIYVGIGVENFGITKTRLLSDFFEAFFFSVQTITSVGYGRYAPTNAISGLVSSIEAFIGLVSFALATGLLYGRFSKPKSNIRFSDNLLYTNFKGGKALMFRLINRRESMVVLPKITVSISISRKVENSGYRNEFYNLTMEREQITYLPTSWTLVHPIDENSPLEKYSANDLLELQAEILILLSYYDDSFNDVLHQAHSYTFEDLKVGCKFKKAFKFNDEGKVVLDHSMLNATEKDF